MMSPPNETATRANPPRKPLTDPAELFRLLGRVGACMGTFLIAVINLFMQRWVEAALFGFISLVLQLWTIQLWRRLRDERIAAKAALAAELDGAEATKEEALNQ